MVLRRCRQLLCGEDEAADAMQDVFVQLLRYQGTLDMCASSSLLFRIATNVCLNKLRTWQRRPADRGSRGGCGPGAVELSGLFDLGRIGSAGGGDGDSGGAYGAAGVDTMALLRETGVLDDDPEKKSLVRNLLNRIWGDDAQTLGLVAVLHYVDGMTLEEVAGETGLSLSGVRRRLDRLRRRGEALMKGLDDEK